MKFDLMNLKGEKVKDVNLDKNIFGIEPNDVALKDAVVLGRAALRQGTHKTKTRSEVSGGGRKPWRQKGTGRARQGSIRAVQWVGGGISTGPVPRDYSKKQNRKERRLALKSAYTYKAKEKNIVLVDKLKLKTPKTSEMVKLLKSLKLDNDKTLIIVLDIMSAKKLLIEEGALEGIKEVLK